MFKQKFDKLFCNAPEWFFVNDLNQNLSCFQKALLSFEVHVVKQSQSKMLINFFKDNLIELTTISINEHRLDFCHFFGSGTSFPSKDCLREEHERG